MESRLLRQSKRGRQGDAFTLLEVISVIAIIAVTAAIIFPVFREVKRSAKITTSIQNMRQQFLLLSLYALDNDGHFPSSEIVRIDAKLQVPCSPMDDWATPCWQRQKPLIGSYAYIEDVKREIEPSLIASVEPFPVLADVFSARYRLGEFSGLSFSNYNDCIRSFSCEFPEVIWFANSDGSVNSTRSLAPSRYHVREMFNWPRVFERELQKRQR